MAEAAKSPFPRDGGLITFRSFDGVVTGGISSFLFRVFRRGDAPGVDGVGSLNSSIERRGKRAASRDYTVLQDTKLEQLLEDCYIYKT